MTAPVRQAAARARAWLTDAALPLWASKGMAPDGVFQERLFFDASPDLTCVRRMRVQARQLYVYSEAAVRGWWPQARTVAEQGFAAYRRRWWSPDGRPGFVHTLNPDLTPLDVSRDTYDHAFALFALAWYYKMSADPAALGLAHQVLDLLDRDLADPVHGGFLESQPPVLPRRSDPHMHLLEAMLEWTEADGDPRFLAIASRMVALFKARFFDPEAGVLGEYFAADLAPAPGAEGQVVAPGHHFEWFWLLDWAERLGAGDARAEAARLYDFGVRHGLDAAGFAVDECDRSGRQLRRSRRAWPQTELIKAYVARAHKGDGHAADAAAAVTLDFLDTYLATDIPGLWMDQFDENGRGITATVPSTTLYHVVVAFRELMRLAEAV